MPEPEAPSFFSGFSRLKAGADVALRGLEHRGELAMLEVAEMRSEVVGVVLLFLAIQTAEGYLLVPFIQQRTVQLPPALLIFSQTVFGALFGVLGLLLAPALMVVIMITVQAVYLHDVLGDRDLAERFGSRR